MKHLFLIGLATFMSINVEAQKDYTKIDPSKNIQMAEVSCGECRFKMKGKGCHLAVKFSGQTYWVSNFDIDSFGDSHDKKMGFCNKIRKANVQGDIKDGKYYLTYIQFTDVKKTK